VIRYQIQALSPQAHIFRTVMHLSEAMPEGQVLRMPAWIPGSYMIRDFARHVVRFEALANDQPLAWRKLDKDSWWVEPTSAPLTIIIEVYAWDLSVRGAHLDTTHAYFNGACVFLQPVGHEDQPIEVQIDLPVGAAYSGWRLATGLPRKSGGEWDEGLFQAENYDALIDHPVEMAAFTSAQFSACDVPHRMVFRGRHHADLDRLCRDLKPICEHHIKMFGEPAPMSDYLFMTMVTGDAYGGLEHRNSTSLMCSRSDLPKRTDAPNVIRDGYRTFLGLCSHEYFHTWNIKRIKPEVFTPFDLSQESYTEQLWAFEGITSYYDDLALVRTGLISPQSYLELVGQTMTRVARSTGTDKQTVTESSFDAWTRFYKQDENSPNAIVSYYAKGALVALALDMLIRDLTDEQRSLDDVMRVLWQQYGKTGIGVPERGIQAAVEGVVSAIVSAESGTAMTTLSAFFDLALYSTEPLPLEELLSKRGVKINLRAPSGLADMGGKATKPANIDLGIKVVDHALGARIAVAFEQGCATAAGLSAGDVLIAIDGLKVNGRKLDDMLSVYQPGEIVEIHAFRDDVLMRFKVTLTPAEENIVWLSVEEGGLTAVGRCWLHVE
jgi:predicted metalloprotease with PDZ domain